MLRRILILVVLAGLCRPGFSAEYLWSSADGGNDHWYHIRDELVTFEEIQDQINNSVAPIPGYAAPTYLSIESADEMAFVAQIIATSLSSSYTAAWIGLSDQAAPGTFAWQNGDSLGYTNWASGEPAGSGGAIIVDPYDPVWEVRPLNDRYWWTAESAPVPEPAGITLAAAALITSLFWRAFCAPS